MSSPQRQVGSRRLPPLPKVVASGYVKTSKGEAKIHQTPQAGSGKLELSTDLSEGPFRPTLTPEAFNLTLNKGLKSLNDKGEAENKDLIIPGNENKVYHIMSMSHREIFYTMDAQLYFDFVSPSFLLYVLSRYALAHINYKVSCMLYPKSLLD